MGNSPSVQSSSEEAQADINALHQLTQQLKSISHDLFSSEFDKPQGKLIFKIKEESIKYENSLSTTFVKDAIKLMITNKLTGVVDAPNFIDGIVDSVSELLPA